MAKVTSVYPYVAVKLVDYELVAFAMNLEAKYKPLDEEGVYWDIQDIQQVCLVYKGIWKSEVEDWKKGCKTLSDVNWAKLALTGDFSNSQVVAAPPTSATPSASIPATSTASAGPAVTAIGSTAAAVTAILPNETPAIANASLQAAQPVSMPALTPEERFTEYRKRTKHRRNRICPNCDEPDCNLSRNIGMVCECGRCEGDDEGEDDEFFKYYDEEHDDGNAANSPASSGASSAESSTSPESTAPKETVASVMVPGHRARVVQCIYVEAF